MTMLLYSKLRQYYKYHRNCRKYRSSSAKREERLSGELQFYSQFVDKDDLCFDIGANIGDKTEAFLRLGAVVVAVEPQESCWRFLQRRFQNDNVKIIPKALDKTAGSKEIYIDRSHTLSSMSPEWIDSVRKSGRFSSHKWSYKLIIETTTLDKLIKEYGVPDFCKIDVEGFEYEVLQGLMQPVKMLSFEFTPEHLEPAIECIQYLIGLGNAEFNYSLADSNQFALPGWINCDKIKSTLTTMDKNTGIFGDIYARFVSD